MLVKDVMEVMCGSLMSLPKSRQYLRKPESRAKLLILGLKKRTIRSTEKED
jgi:hypothetical protein